MLQPKQLSKIGVAVVTFIACFALAFLVGSLTFIPYDSDASSTNSNTLVKFEIDPNLSLHLSTSTIVKTIIPTDTLAGEDMNAYVTTNNPTGYMLTMNTTTNNTALVSLDTNVTDTIPSIINTTSNVAEPLTANTWGYNKGTKQIVGGLALGGSGTGAGVGLVTALNLSVFS